MLCSHHAVQRKVNNQPSISLADDSLCNVSPSILFVIRQEIVLHVCSCPSLPTNRTINRPLVWLTICSQHVPCRIPATRFSVAIERLDAAMRSSDAIHRCVPAARSNNVIQQRNPAALPLASEMLDIRPQFAGYITSSPAVHFTTINRRSSDVIK
jgi:hypothetical protein